jgi:hypothetical protein
MCTISVVKNMLLPDCNLAHVMRSSYHCPSKEKKTQLKGLGN